VGFETFCLLHVLLEVHLLTHEMQEYRSLTSFSCTIVPSC